MIKVEELSFAYNKNEEFINNLSVEVAKGKITTILGPNGSGKSTLLSLLCGLNKARAGKILIEGKDITKLKYKDIAKIVATVHQQIYCIVLLLLEKMLLLLLYFALLLKYFCLVSSFV